MGATWGVPREIPRGILWATTGSTKGGEYGYNGVTTGKYRGNHWGAEGNTTVTKPRVTSLLYNKIERSIYLFVYVCVCVCLCVCLCVCVHVR